MIIESLEQQHVFVFGSNEIGFHGAGAALFAFAGPNVHAKWHDVPQVQNAIANLRNNILTIGYAAVWGVGSGLMRGTNAWSFAIPTVKAPGGKQIDISSIEADFAKLLCEARSHSDLEFIMTPVGTGFARYSLRQIRDSFFKVVRSLGVLPQNITNLDCFDIDGEPWQTELVGTRKPTQNEIEYGKTLEKQ